jgi:hypothetical protein
MEGSGGRGASDPQGAVGKEPGVGCASHGRGLLQPGSGSSCKY